MDGFGGGLGDASGSIRLDASGAISALNQFGGALESTDRQSAQWGNGLAGAIEKNEQAIKTVGTTLTGVGLAITGGFGLAINTAANFEQQMSAVGSVTGATGKDLEALSDEAMRLGAATSFSATEAAEAMEIMAKAGVSVEDMAAGATEDILNLANAAGVSVPEAAEVAATAMTVFGVSSEEAADIIAQSANASALDVNDWALVMKSAAPVAAGLGISMDDLAQAMVILGDAGIKGQVGGTALRNILMNLSDTTNEGTVALGEMGIATYDAQGNFRGLEAIATDLTGAWSTMTDEQRINLAQQIAGRDGAAAFMTIMEAQTKAVEDGGSAFQTATERMLGTGTAATQAAARMDNFKGAWEEMTGALETAMILIGSRLLPAVKAFANTMQGLIQRFIALPEGVQTAIAAITGIIGVLSLAAGGFLLMLPRIMEVRRALQALGGIRGVIQLLGQSLRMLVMGNPILLGLAVAAAAFVAYQTNFLGFRDAVNALASAFMNLDVVQTAIGWFRELQESVGEFIDGFTSAWASLDGNPIEKFLLSVSRGFAAINGEDTPKWLAQVARAFTTLNGKIKQITSALGKFRAPLRTIVEGFRDILSGNFTRGWDTIKRGADGVWRAFQNLQGVVSGMAVGFLGLVSTGIDTIFDRLIGAVPQLSGFLDSLRDSVQYIIDAFIDLAEAAGKIIEGDWDGAWEEIQSAAQNAVDGILEMFTVLPNLLMDIFDAVDWSGIWDFLTDTVGSIDWGGIGSAIMSGMRTAIGFLGDVASDIWNWFTGQLSGVNWQGAWETALSVLSAVGTWVYNALGDAIANIGTWLSAQVSGVDWEGAFTSALSVLGAIGSWVVNAFVDMTSAIGTWVSDQVGRVNWKAAFQAGMSAISNAGAWIAEKLGDAWETIQAWVSDQVTSVDWASVGSSFGSKFRSAITTAVQGMVTIAATILSWLSSQIDSVNWSSLGSKVASLLVAGIKGVAALIGLAGWLFLKIIQALGDVSWSSVGTSFKNFFRSAITAIWDFFTGFATTIYNEIVAMLGAVDWAGVKSAIAGFASGLWDAFVDELEPIIEKVVGLVNRMIGALNQIPGVHIEPIKYGFEGMGIAVGQVTGQVEKLQDTLANLKWDKAHEGGSGGTNAAPGGTTPGGTGIIEGGGGGGGAGGLDEMRRRFDDLALSASLTNTELGRTPGIMSGVVSTGSAVSEWASIGKGAFDTTGTAANTNISPIPGLAGAMSSALLASAVPAFVAMQTSAATNFAGMQAAVATQTSLASTAGTNNTNTLKSNVASNLLSMASDAKTRSSAMNRDVAAETLGMKVAALVQMASMKATSALHFTSMAQTSKDQATAMANAMRRGAGDAAKAVSNELGRVPGIISNIGGSARSAAYAVGASISEGMAAGMRSALGSINAAAAAMVAAAETAVRARARIASPSKLFRDIFAYIGEGSALGIRDEIPTVVRQARNMVDAVASQARTADMLVGARARTDMRAMAAYSPTPATALGGTTTNVTVVTLPTEEWLRVSSAAERGKQYAEAWSKPGAISRYTKRT